MINAQEKYLNKKTKKNGNIQNTINQLIKLIQFFFVLNTLIREKASDQSCFVVGTTNVPFSSAHPYEGACKRVSINLLLAIRFGFCLRRQSSTDDKILRSIDAALIIFSAPEQQPSPSGLFRLQSLLCLLR